MKARDIEVHKWYVDEDGTKYQVLRIEYPRNPFGDQRVFVWYTKIEVYSERCLLDDFAKWMVSETDLVSEDDGPWWIEYKDGNDVKELLLPVFGNPFSDQFRQSVFGLSSSAWWRATRSDGFTIERTGSKIKYYLNRQAALR